MRIERDIAIFELNFPKVAKKLIRTAGRVKLNTKIAEKKRMYQKVPLTYPKMCYNFKASDDVCIKTCTVLDIK